MFVGRHCVGFARDLTSVVDTRSVAPRSCEGRVAESELPIQASLIIAFPTK
jgi:hypothetical protein